MKTIDEIRKDWRDRQRKCRADARKVDELTIVAEDMLEKAGVVDLKVHQWLKVFPQKGLPYLKYMVEKHPDELREVTEILFGSEGQDDPQGGFTIGNELFKFGEDRCGGDKPQEDGMTIGNSRYRHDLFDREGMENRPQNDSNPFYRRPEKTWVEAAIDSENDLTIGNSLFQFSRPYEEARKRKAMGDRHE